MNRTPITDKGAVRLRHELQALKNVERPKIIQEISEARAHGDLKENAEYHAAKERQSFIEGRIAEIEGVVTNAEIIDPASVDAGDRVVFGATVTLLNLDEGNEVCYQIVGEIEADISEGLISVTSPTARAMIGKSLSDDIVVQAPGGEISYEIVGVTYE